MEKWKNGKMEKWKNGKIMTRTCVSYFVVLVKSI
jgi:hypothetical protein